MRIRSIARLASVWSALRYQSGDGVLAGPWARNPPSIAPDPTAQAAALQAQIAAAAKAKDLTPEMVEDAQEAKEEGNEAFKKQDYKEAFARCASPVFLTSFLVRKDEYHNV